jgi:nucleoid-associated protein YejK
MSRRRRCDTVAPLRQTWDTIITGREQPLILGEVFLYNPPSARTSQMNIKRLVIHEIRKAAQSVGAELFLSEQVQDIELERPQKLCEKLTAAFLVDKNKVDYAVCRKGESFPNHLKSYLDSERGDKEFLDFTGSTLTQLKDQVMNIPAAKGGYLVFAEYLSQQREFIAVFLVRDTTGEIFTHAKGMLQIDEVIYADTSKLAMACRFNVGMFQTDTGRPLLLINKRSEEVSEYFSRWLGVGEKESSEEYSEQLYDIISRLPPPTKPDSKESFTVDETRKRVFELIKVDSHGMANLNTISQVVYGDETMISTFIEKEGIEIPTEFKTYSRTMRKFVQIRVNRDGILLQMSRGDLRKVSFGDNEDTVIINSKSLADELRQQKEYELSGNV